MQSATPSDSSQWVGRCSPHHRHRSDRKRHGCRRARPISRATLTAGDVPRRRATTARRGLGGRAPTPRRCRAPWRGPRTWSPPWGAAAGGPPARPPGPLPAAAPRPRTPPPAWASAAVGTALGTAATTAAAAAEAASVSPPPRTFPSCRAQRCPRCPPALLYRLAIVSRKEAESGRRTLPVGRDLQGAGATEKGAPDLTAQSAQACAVWRGLPGRWPPPPRREAGRQSGVVRSPLLAVACHQLLCQSSTATATHWREEGEKGALRNECSRLASCRRVGG